jgi:hypothetical protein
MVPAVQLELSQFSGDDGRTWLINDSHNNYALCSSYGPEIDKRVRRHLKPADDSWRVDETYIKVKGKRSMDVSILCS